MRFKKVKVNQTKLCWNEQDLYFHQKTIREYSVKHDSFFHTCLTFCKYVWEKPNLCVKYHTCSFWQMFDFYPTCLEKNKHVGIFTPRCYFPHMFGFWHICVGKGTHVWKKPHNYMFANVRHFPLMCGKSHRPAYFPLSFRWPGIRGPSMLNPWLRWNSKNRARDFLDEPSLVFFHGMHPFWFRLIKCILESRRCGYMLHIKYRPLSLDRGGN